LENEAVNTLQRNIYKDYQFECKATPAEARAFLKKNPLMRMPFGVPQLKKAEFERFESYVADGAPAPSAKAAATLAAPSVPAVIDEWQRFLNGGDKRQLLVARYLFEHMYSHHLHFSQMPGEFYRLFRSSKSCEAPQEIRTELVTDPPKVGRVYYCFEKYTGLIAQKNHVPWEIGPKTLARYRKLFLGGSPSWELKKLPGYDSSNQFIYFEAIPSKIRYMFLLENARAIVDALVRGDVCKGQGATYAISDLFWVFFLKPDSDVSARSEGPKLSHLSWRNLGAKPEFGPFEVDLKLVEKNVLGNKEYLAAFEFETRRLLKDRQLEGVEGKAARALARVQQLSTGLSIQRDIWDGTRFDGEAGHDLNSMIQVTRHGRSATVQFGRKGGRPQAIWVMNYANLERLYYNLVVQFKYWENLAHKFGTWRHMSYVRREGEDLFLSFLPSGDRREVRSHYTKGLKGFATAENLLRFPDHSLLPMLATRLGSSRPSGESNFKAGTPLARAEELVGRFLSHVNPKEKDPLNTVPTNIPSDVKTLDEVVAAFGSLARHVPGEFQRWIADTNFVRVHEGEKVHYFTVLGNRAYDIGDVVFLQGLARRPDEDTHSVYEG
ncbi:MAG: fatty acid cis/trans isomerase, partial [Bdellovibrionales bacterium]|nr:fatty acid cis/trans isomerase [Bdellovibrionales bacterium]